MKKNDIQTQNQQTPLLQPIYTERYPFENNLELFVGFGDYILQHEALAILEKTVGVPVKKSKLKAFLVQRCNIPDPTHYSFPDIIAALQLYIQYSSSENIVDKSSKTENKIYPVHIEKAYQSYYYAIDKNLQLTGKKDEDIYNWLKENGIEDYHLPPLDSWKRYVRAGRKHYGTSKNTPRAGRTPKTAISTTDPAVTQITSKFTK